MVLDLLVVGLLVWPLLSLLLLGLLLLTAFLFFIARGYVLCISCWPGNLEAGESISLATKIKTFLALLVYIPLFLAARIEGSIRHRRFLF